MQKTILVLQIVVTDERWSCNSVVVNDGFHCSSIDSTCNIWQPACTASQYLLVCVCVGGGGRK